MRIPALVRARTATMAGVALLAALITAALVLVIPGLTAPASAVDVLQGQGTAASPYLISSDADLDQARAMINADTAHTGAATADYELTTNLDYSQDSSNTTNALTANWAGFDWFTGVFNGDGHTITNLTYTTDSASIDGTTLGLFRVTNGATIENLTVNNANFNTSTNTNDGGVVGEDYGSTITGVSVTNSTFKETAAGDVGGVAGQALADNYADATSTAKVSSVTSCPSSDPMAVSDETDGAVDNFTNDSVTGGSITGSSYAAGITGYAKGPVNITDNYVNTALAVTGSSPKKGDDAGGLVAYMGTTDCTSTGADAAPVSMTNNVISGSITYSTSGARSNAAGSENYSSPTIGWGDTSADTSTYPKTQYDNWATSNDLVSTSLTYTDATGTGLTAAAEGDADGVSVSPTTLQTEATYSGNATGQTDATTSANYNQLGWNVGATIDGSDTLSSWTWNSTANAPQVTQAPDLTVGQSTLDYETTASPSDAALLTAIDATSTGTTPAVDSSAVNFGTVGSYTAMVSSSSQGLTSIVPVTINVVPVPVISVTNSTVDVSKGSTVTSNSVLQAAGAELTDGSGSQLTGGTVAADVSSVNTAVPGPYTVTLTGSDAQGFMAQSVTVTVDVAAVSVNLGQPTIHVEATSSAPSSATILSDLQATLPGGNNANLTVDLSSVSFKTPGTYTAVVSDSEASDGATPVDATIDIVPVPVITPTSTTVTLNVNSATPTADSIIGAAGATLTDGNGNAVQGTVTATLPGGGISTSAPGGPYTVTLNGTDQFGDNAAPVTITVNVAWTTAPVITVANPTIFVSAQLGSAPTELALIQELGATVDHGTISLDLTGINWASPAAYPITINASDTGTPSSSANATIVVSPLVGSGTAADPFQIGNLSDLQTAQTLVNTGSTAYQSADYELTSNVDLAGADWGGFDFFSGVFNGQGHTISNGTLTTDNTAVDDPGDLGFFHVLSQGTVENVSFNSLQITSGATNNGIVVGEDFASTVTDVSLINPSILGTTGGDQGLFAGQTLSNTYADNANSSPITGVTTCASSNPMNHNDETDGDTASFTNDTVVNGTITTPSYASGVTGYAKGPITIADNDINANLTVTGGAPAKGHDAGVLVAYMGTTDCTATGADAAGVEMSNNVISGSITYKTGGARSSSGDQSFSSPTVGWATTSGTSPQYDNWTVSNNLVSSGLTYTNATGSGLNSAVEGNADGSSVSPSTLQTQATYSGNATGQTDTNTSTTYNQLGWDFTTPVWAWNNPSDAPVLANVPQLTEPTITVGTPSFTYSANAVPSDTQILSDLAASITPASGTLSLNLEGADLSTPGTYQVEVDGTLDGAPGWPEQATITIVAPPTITTQLTTIQYAAGAPVTMAQFLSDVGAQMSSAGGTLSADLSGVDFDTPGDYTVVINGIDAQNFGATPVDVTVEILPGQGGTTGNQPPPSVTEGEVAIDGTSQVGTQLTADPGTWSPAGSPTFQWLENGSPLAGQTSATYTPQPQDAGNMLQVAVTEDGETVTSAGVTVGAGTLTGFAPTISGTPTVGDTLTASVDWAYSDLAVTYQWLSNGLPIMGAVGSTYTLQAADANQQISVEVVGGLAGYSPLKLTSQPVQVQPAPQSGGGTNTQPGGSGQSNGNGQSNGGGQTSETPKAITGPVPTIIGTATTGQTLTLSTGTWTTGSSLAYQWFVDGQAVSGATGSSFKLTAADVGKAISVQVTGSASGATAGSQTAAAVKAGKGKLHGVKPNVKGTAKVGATLTTTAGDWGPKPKFAYQWYVNGKALKGATKASLKLTAADRGKRVSVKVSGGLAGYATLTETSATTKAVK